MRRLLFVLFCMALVRCSNEGMTTQLIVLVDSDFAVPAELAEVRAVVRDDTGGIAAEQLFKLVAPSAMPGPAEFRLPLSFGVSFRQGAANQSVQIELEAIGPGTAGDPRLFTRRVITSFIEGKTLLLPIFIARRCVSLLCAPSETCTEHGCASPDIPASMLQEVDPGGEQMFRFDGGVGDSDGGEMMDGSVPGAFVTAQFDPLHPIPVLQVIPSPAGIFQDQTNAELIPEKVKPPPCALPSLAQCAAASKRGWPVSTPIVLYFSAAIDPNTVAEGIHLFAEDDPTPIAFDVASSDRPPPPVSCMSGSNGSDPEQSYTAADVPPGIQLVLTPRTPIKDDTKYFLAVVSSATGGLRGSAGERVVPSSAFAALRETAIPADPVLRDMHSFFQAAIGELGDHGFAREDLAFATSWRTGGAQTVFELDPSNGIMPFPNVELMTVEEMGGRLRVDLPAPMNEPSAMAALRVPLNTLDGFSLEPTISFSASGDLDPATIPQNLVMVPLDDMGNVDGPELLLTAVYDAAEQAITMTPNELLQPDKRYAIGVKRGVRDTAGHEVGAPDLFKVLQIDHALIDANGEVFRDLVVPGSPLSLYEILQCSTAASTGRLASDATVKSLATTIENLVRHQRWLEPVRALAPRELLLAWSHKTQSIFSYVDRAKQGLESGAWDAFLGPQQSIVGPLVEINGQSNIVNTLQVTEKICIPYCEAGAMLPTVDPTMCASRDANGNIIGINGQAESHSLCQTMWSLVAGNIGSLQYYVLRSFHVAEGNPFDDVTLTEEPRIVDIPFWVVIPDTPMPMTGYPVIVFQHDLGGKKEDGFFVANTLASMPEHYATILMDLDFHGDRVSDLVNNRTGVACPQLDPADIDCFGGGPPGPEPRICLGTGCDGVPDPDGAVFLGPNLMAVRNHLLQATIDQLTLIYALRERTVPGEPLDVLLDENGTWGIIGQSFGAIPAANLIAHAGGGNNYLSAAALNAPAGELAKIVLTSSTAPFAASMFASFAAGGVCELREPMNPGAGCISTALYLDFLTRAQWLLEPGDPYFTASGAQAFGTMSILEQMARPDLIMPNAATEALAFQYGHSSSPNFQVWDVPLTDCHDFLTSWTCGLCPAEQLCRTYNAQYQAAAFISSGGMTITPQDTMVGGIIPCSSPCN